MKIHIDLEYKCHTEPAEDRVVVETDFFNGKCKAYIEGYRFVPSGSEWIRPDGVAFQGEMIAPWKDYSILAAAQATYEELLAEMQDMREALELLTITEE